MLFSVGVFLALVLNLLQVQRNVTLFPPDVLSSIFSSAWWVPPCCGSASGTSHNRLLGEELFLSQQGNLEGLVQPGLPSTPA